MNRYDLHMPAEWVLHERTWMEWPVKDSLVWAENYEEVCEGYAETARAIGEFEPLSMIVNPDTAAEAERLCGTANIEYITIPHDDAWCRDNGSTIVFHADGTRIGINWKFNAWGGKYPNCAKDDLVAASLLEYYAIPKIDASIVLEGGSIHTDGQGTLLTTKECLLHPNRNPNLGQAEIESVLTKLLGVRKIIWLNHGLFGDETDGHIDNVACFAMPGVILMQVCDDPSDPNYAITQENRAVLANATDAEGRAIRLIEIPQPPARYYQGERLTLSYLNFYFVNGGIILPIFGCDAKDADARTIAILTEVFPDRRIKTVDGMKLIKEGGNVHCITQQMPSVIQ
ncbi:MAG: agmatine/peptidylarginine deiminase [Anaerofustis sp.]